MIPEKSQKSFLKTRLYALYWISSLLSNIGTWMQQVAEPWVVLSLSNSPFWVGLDSFAMNAPSLIFTLFGGILADRFDRKKIVLLFQTIQWLCILIMLTLLILGWLKVWMIVIISFLIGLTDSLSMPSFQTIIPSIVDEKEIPKALSLNSTQFNLSRILGPAIAGVVIAKYGVVACFSANAISYLPFFLSLYFIYPRKIKIENAVKVLPTKPLEHFKEFKQLLHNSKIRLPLFTSFINGLFCAPLITFCSVLVKNNFHAQVGSFGGAMAAFGMGGLLGATISFIPLPKSFTRNKFSNAIAIFLGMIVIAIAFNRSLLLLYILLVIAGAMLTTSNIGVITFLQQNANNSIRGRIVSLYQLALAGGISMGALLTGFTVSQFSIETAFLINGSMAVALQSFVLWFQFKIPTEQIKQE